MEQLYQQIFLFVRKRINNKEDAEDLTQDVFYKLSKSDNTAIDSVKKWVYTIARNSIIDYYRKTKIYTDELEQQVYESESLDLQAVNGLSSCMGTFIKKLPADYQELMQLSEIKGMSQKDIATQLNLNYVTVRSKIQRGRKQLKAIVLDCCHVMQGGKGSIIDFKRNNGCDNKC